jgi:hypothetical protein
MSNSPPGIRTSATAAGGDPLDGGVGEGLVTPGDDPSPHPGAQAHAVASAAVDSERIADVKFSMPSP